MGLFFSVLMIGLTAIQSRYTGFSPKTSEEFNSASRSVKPGLIAAGIVSAWTWAATLVCRRSLRLCRLDSNFCTSFNRLQLLTNMAYLDHGGMELAQPFKFYSLHRLEHPGMTPGTVQEGC